MTGEALRELLATAEQALVTNKQVVTIDMIDLLKALSVELRGNPVMLKKLIGKNAELKGDFPLDKICDIMDNILQLEEKLIGASGDTAITIANHLQRRPIILALLAKVVG